MYLLTVWTIDRFAAQNAWGSIGVTEEEKLSTLDLLMCLAGINKEIHTIVANTAEFAALRLTVHDARLYPNLVPLKSDMVRINLEILRTSWSLSIPMPKHLCLLPFSALCTWELVDLRRWLNAGWSCPMPTPCSMLNHDPLVWVTPEARLTCERIANEP